jgi:hypothetical protein
MVNSGRSDSGRRGSRWRIAGWSGAAGLLLLPLVAMQFTDEVVWDGTDFIFAGVLIGGVGVAFELTVRITRNNVYRAGIAAALAATFLLIWINAAVGMIGSANNPLNLMFAGLLAIAVLGAILARFRPDGMACAMTVAAIAQVLAGAIGMFTDLRGGILSAVFAAPWLLSAGLFWKAAREQTLAGAASADRPA